MTRLARNEVKFKWNDLCEDIPGIKEKAYLSYNYDSPREGTKVHNVL